MREARSRKTLAVASATANSSGAAQPSLAGTRGCAGLRVAMGTTAGPQRNLEFTMQEATRADAPRPAPSSARRFRNQTTARAHRKRPGRRQGRECVRPRGAGVEPAAQSLLPRCLGAALGSPSARGGFAGAATRCERGTADQREARRGRLGRTAGEAAFSPSALRPAAS